MVRGRLKLLNVTPRSAMRLDREISGRLMRVPLALHSERMPNAAARGRARWAVVPLWRKSNSAEGTGFVLTNGKILISVSPCFSTVQPKSSRHCSVVSMSSHSGTFLMSVAVFVSADAKRSLCACAFDAGALMCPLNCVG